MSIATTAVRRVFLYNGRTLPDPDPAMSADEVRLFYSAIHADLVNAVVQGGRFEGDVQTFEFKRGVGTKG